MKHQSDCSIQYYNENFVVNDMSSSRRVSIHPNAYCIPNESTIIQTPAGIAQTN